MPLTGRPSKLTPESAARAVRVVRRGGGRAEAARAAGVATSTFMSWMERGREGEAGYRSFLARIEAAETKAHLDQVDRRAAEYAAKVARLRRVLDSFPGPRPGAIPNFRTVFRRRRSR